MCIRDSAYIDAQVQMHTMVLDMITTQMLPAAQNPELKAELEAMRGAIEAVSYTHLRAHETVLDLVCRLLLEKKKK